MCLMVYVGIMEHMCVLPPFQLHGETWLERREQARLSRKKNNRPWENPRGIRELEVPRSGVVALCGRTCFLGHFSMSNCRYSGVR